MAEAALTRHEDSYQYHSGFGGYFESEALPDALPKTQNSPLICPYGLYAEQLSGTAFTVPRINNQRSWLYRILPAVKHSDFKKIPNNLFTNKFDQILPNQLRWLPFPLASSDSKVDFVQGMKTLGGAGDPTLKTGLAIYIYACNAPMVDKAFYNSDGDMLIVPEHGALRIRTEFGYIFANQGEIVVIQRCVRFSVEPVDGSARGYVCEVFSGHFRIPDLGPIGANGLANPRDFQHPVASFEDRTCKFEVVNKFAGELFSCEQNHSCFDVVAWHGNYVPYKYDLNKFCPVGSVGFDHPDPSIFTVLTCPSLEAGVAVCDFVFFPPRWAVAEHTFRPPYYHRNVMSEFMGLIRGKYEAKEKGFLPGGGSLHSCGTPHGPDRDVFEATVQKTLRPERVAENDMAFMFESTFMLKLTELGATAPNLDHEYMSCWQPLQKHFDPSWKLADALAAAAAPSK